MKICVAQTKPFTGDIARNIEAHIKLVSLAATHKADLIIFPELSLTGYEPTLAKDLAIEPDDAQFNCLQECSNAYQITIGVGVPTKNEEGTCITMVLFRPHKERQTYSKKYLHADEEAFFVSGQNTTAFLGEDNEIALAICYELSVPEHAENAFAHSAKLYVASVAKTLNGVEKACDRLAYIANSYGMTVLMANSVGPTDGEVGAGKSSIWNNHGVLLGQLNEVSEGILLLDTVTKEVSEMTL